MSCVRNFGLGFGFINMAVENLAVEILIISINFIKIKLVIKIEKVLNNGFKFFYFKSRIILLLKINILLSY